MVRPRYSLGMSERHHRNKAEARRALLEQFEDDEILLRESIDRVDSDRKSFEEILDEVPGERSKKILSLLASGFPPKDVARYMGITREVVRLCASRNRAHLIRLRTCPGGLRARTSHAFEDILVGMRNRLVPKELERLMGSESESIRMRVIENLLDRSGVTRGKTVEVTETGFQQHFHSHRIEGFLSAQRKGEVLVQDPGPEGHLGPAKENDDGP